MIQQLLNMNNGKKFDVILMNPPYSGKNTGDSIYIDFINKCIEISNVVDVVSPLGGLLGHNEHGSAAGKNVILHNLMDEYKPSIYEILNTFDAGIKGKVGITIFDKTHHSDKITIEYVNGVKLEFDNQISIIDNNNKYLTEFKSKLYKYMIGEDTNDFINLKYPYIYKGRNKEDIVEFKQDNLYNHLYYGKNGEGFSKFKIKIEKTIDTDKYYIFIFKPNSSFGEFLYKQTYYEPIKYQNEWFEKGLCYIKCDSKQVGENICKYLRSDFCRLINRLRTYFHTYLRFDFVPWLDFSKSYTDEELFNMIDMEYNKEEINNILKDNI